MLGNGALITTWFTRSWLQFCLEYMYALSSSNCVKAACTVLVVCTSIWLVPRTRAVGPAELSNDIPASQSLYSRHCAECHGADGRAKTAKGKRAGATDFTSDWNTDEARGIRIITNGRDEMPSFKKKLTAAEIRSVWSYVIRFKK